MAVTTIPTAGIADDAVTTAKTSYSAFPFRNLIINGDMSIAQRGTSFTGVTTSAYHLDRFSTYVSNDGALTVSQSTDAPNGFSNSYKLEVTTADTSIGSNQYAQVGHKIEAQNLQHLSYGTSSAKTVTLSFWVKSNKTGTYCICYSKDDTTRYDYVSEYIVNLANTWEKKVITIVPDSNIQASSGAITNDNGTGIFLKFILSAGSGRQGTNNTWNSTVPADATSNQVNWLDSTSNDFYFTGVQLEVGTSASDFEFLPHDVNLQRCQRYCYAWGNYGAGNVDDNRKYSLRYYTSASFIAIDFPTQMRIEPTVTYSAGGGPASNDYSNLNGLQLYDSDSTGWYIYDVLLEAEL